MFTAHLRPVAAMLWTWTCFINKKSTQLLRASPLALIAAAARRSREYTLRHRKSRV
jgi:hypothetical protein